MKRRRTLLVIVSVVLCLAVSSSLINAAARRGKAKAQPPKEKTSKAGMAGTTVESFKLTSPAMKRDIDVVVILPPGYAADAAKRYPVLYTLHGRGAPYGVFKEMSTVHKALKEKPMIVVGFNADRASWYLDATQKADSQFTTFFFNTLIPSIDGHYRTVAEAKKRAVTGFSMGGFGAMHYLLTRPAAFASASAMSGAFAPLDVGWLAKDFKTLLGEADKSNASKAAYGKADLKRRTKAAAKKKVRLPPIYITCGTEDGLLASSRAMRDLLKQLKLTCEYAEAPGGHNFKFWKTAATEVIDFHWRTFQDDYKPALAGRAAKSNEGKKSK